MGTSGRWVDFNSFIDNPLALSGKVIDGITKVAYTIFFCRGEILDRKTAALNFFAFAMCILVASVLLCVMFMW